MYNSITDAVNTLRRKDLTPDQVQKVKSYIQNRYDLLRAQGYWRDPQNQGFGHQLRTQGLVTDASQGMDTTPPRWMTAPPGSQPALFGGKVRGRTLSGGAGQYGSVDGSDPLALPNTPIANDINANGGLAQRTAFGGVTLAQYLNGTSGYFDKDGNRTSGSNWKGPVVNAITGSKAGKISPIKLVRQPSGYSIGRDAQGQNIFRDPNGRPTTKAAFDAAQSATQRRMPLQSDAPDRDAKQIFNEAVDEAPQTLATAGDAIGNFNKKVVQGGYDLVSNLPAFSLAYPQLKDPRVRNFVGNAAQDVGPVVVGLPQYLLSLSRFYGAETAAGINVLRGDKAAARQAQAAANQTGDEIVNGMTGGPNGAAAKSVRALGYLYKGDTKLAGATMQNVVNGIGKNAYEHPLQFAMTVSMVGDGMIAVAEKAAAGMEYRAGLFNRAANKAYKAGDTEAFHAATAKSEELQQAVHTLRNRINTVRKATFRPTVPQKEVAPPERVAPRVAGAKPGTGAMPPLGAKTTTTPRYVPGKALYKTSLPSQSPAPGDVPSATNPSGAPPIPSPPREQPNTIPSSGASAGAAEAPRVSASNWRNQMGPNEFGATQPVHPHANISHVEMADGSTRFPGVDAHTDLNGHPIDPRQVVTGTDNNGNVIATRRAAPAVDDVTAGTPAPARNPRALTNSELNDEIGRRQATVEQSSKPTGSPGAPTTANDQYLQALKQERVNRMFRTIYSLPPIEAGDTILDKQGNAWRATAPDQYGQVTVTRGGRKKTFGFGDVGEVRAALDDGVSASQSGPDGNSKATASSSSNVPNSGGVTSTLKPQNQWPNYNTKVGDYDANKLLNTIMPAISTVHNVTKIPKVEFRTDSLENLINYKYEERHGTYNKDKRLITVAKDGPYPHLTAIHEVGHSFDDTLSSDRNRYATSGPEMDDFNKAAHNSKSIKELKKLWGNKARTDRAHIEYLLKPEEIFARFYEQHVAQQAARRVGIATENKLPPNPEDVIITKEWARKRNSDDIRRYPHFWDKNDPYFDQMETAFKNVLRAKRHE